MLFHLIRPVVDLKHTVIGIKNYPPFIKDLFIYKKLERGFPVPWRELNPQLHDKTPTTPVDYHYFYQQLWVFKRVLQQKPAAHLDIGSSYDLSGYLSQIVPTTFVDLRPIDVQVEGLKIVKGDITNLSFDSNSQESVSCLHVVEHIGLGRYGDKLDPDGTRKACRELARVLKPDGRLYLSVPIGHERVCFNAHQIFHPQTILNYFDGLQLIKFSVVDDERRYFENANYKNFTDLDYGCGLFLFEKRKTR